MLKYEVKCTLSYTFFASCLFLSRRTVGLKLPNFPTLALYACMMPAELDQTGGGFGLSMVALACMQSFREFLYL